MTARVVTAHVLGLHMFYCYTCSMTTQGQWFPSKRLADKSAALRAVEELDRAGELDERLKPVVRSEDSEDEDEEDDRKREKSRSHAGTERAHDCYRNEVSAFGPGVEI